MLIYAPQLPLVHLQSYLTKCFETVPVPYEDELHDEDNIQVSTQSIRDWCSGSSIDDGDGANNDGEQHDEQQGNGPKLIMYAILMLQTVLITRGGKGFQKEEDWREPKLIDELVARIEEHLDKCLATFHVIAVRRPISSSSSSSSNNSSSSSSSSNTAKAFRRRLHRGADRVTRDLAQHAMYYFQLGGLGVNTTCSGVLASLVSLERTEIVLSGTGTVDCNIKPKRSGVSLLFDEATTRRLLGIQPNEPLGFDYNQSEPPWHGLHVLWKEYCELVPRKDILTREGNLFYQEDNDPNYYQPSGTPPERHQILAEHFLGGRMFNSVYKLNNNDNRVYKLKEVDNYRVVSKKKKYVVKIPIIQTALTWLKREKELLDDLGPHEAIPAVKGWMKVTWTKKCDCIKTRFVDLITSSFSNGAMGGSISLEDMTRNCTCCLCETTEWQALRLGCIVGKPASEFSKDIVVLTMIYRGIQAALLYANCEKNIIHLGIRPRHIIVEPGTGRVQLVDWGCAARTSDTMTTFRGSASFAHDELLFHRPNPWQAKREHDLASFAYTMAALVYHVSSKPPWCSVYYKSQEDDETYLIRRREKATKLIMESGLPETIKEELMMVIQK